MYKNRSRGMILVLAVMLLFSAVVVMGGKEVSAGKLPTITIESYELTKGDFSPGTKSTVLLRVKNNGVKYAADSVTVTFSSNEGVSPVFGTDNQVIIDSISAGETKEIKFEVEVPVNIETQKASMDFAIAYSVFGTGEEYQTFTNAVNISIPVQYDQTFSVNNVSVADTTSVGATTLVSISYSNGASSEVKNIVLNIEGNIDADTKKLEIGDLSGGQTEYKDTYVKFLSSGTQNLTMSVTYTDADGRKITKDLGTSTVEVSEGNTAETGSQITVESDNSVKYMKIAIIAIAILFAAAFAVTIAMKRKD